MRRRHHMAVSCEPAAIERDVARGAPAVAFYAPQGGDSRPPQAISGMEPARATILVIEDHRPTRTFLADNLSADGHDVLEAESIAHARRVLETAYPDAA